MGIIKSLLLLCCFARSKCSLVPGCTYSTPSRSPRFPGNMWESGRQLACYVVRCISLPAFLFFHAPCSLAHLGWLASSLPGCSPQSYPIHDSCSVLDDNARVSGWLLANTTSLKFDQESMEDKYIEQEKLSIDGRSTHFLFFSTKWMKMEKTFWLNP